MRQWTARLFHDVFRSVSQRYLERNLLTFDNPEIFKNEDMAEHFAHTYLEDIASQNVVQGFIIERIQFISSILTKEQIREQSFIDIGDPDGIFIKAFGKKGISANISETGVTNIRRKGLEAVRCDAEFLPFKDNSIDHVLFFEIFEHLSNPIGSLKELHRIAGKSVIISIPYLSTTTIHQYNYCPDWPLFEHHIFEFDDKDFRKVVSHAGFSVQKHSFVDVLVPISVKEHLAFLLWSAVQYVRKDPEYHTIHRDLYLGCFKRFSIYYLIKCP